MIIYKATNKITNKCYIGQTIKTLHKRKNNHYCRANNLKSNNYFARTLKKYGKDNFEWEIVEKCDSKKELDEMEFHYIKQYDSFKPNGYNLTLGGDAGTYGWIPSKETKENISKANKGRKHIYMIGKNNPAKRPEVRRKISEAHKGKKLTKEHKIKISEALKGRKQSKETRKKISEALKGKTYEDIYGKVKAAKIRKIHKKTLQNSKSIGRYIRTNETKEKFRQSRAKFLYTIRKPDGTIEETNSMRNFCKLNNLDKGSMFYHFKNNTNNHKNYKIISRRNNEI